MTHAPIIHVIIPVYNAEKYIAQALDSVLAQPYPHIQIVCVDDGSPDNSILILREYERKHSNIHVVQQINSGVSAARNTGIEYVLKGGDSGYITFLDADDLWAKNATKGIEKDLKEQPDCIGYRYVRCCEDLTKASPAPGLESRMLPGGNKSIWCHFDYHFCSVLYSCRFLKNYPVRFVEKLSYAEDSIFKFSCFYLARQIRLVDRVFYCYRINSASAMHHRKYGTEYMPGIIRGYLKTAAFLQPYENDQRGSSKFCNIMAGVHVLEMIEEHYQKFRSNRKLSRFLSENPDILAAINCLDRNDLSDNHQQLYDLYFMSPMRFRIKCYLAGVRLIAANVLKVLPPVVKYLHQKRYPLPNTYL